MALTKKYLYEIKGVHEYEGILYNSVMPAKGLERIKNQLELTKDDIILSTYPKSGTTWMQEVIFLLCNGGDVKKAQEKSLDERFPFLEFHIPILNSDLNIIESQKPPRIMKTHLYANFFERMLNKGGDSPKCIFGVRNPKDTLVSFYHFYRMNNEIGNFPGSWDEWFEIFRADQLIYGNLLDHTLSWLKYKDHPNVHILVYEDMHKNLRGTINSLAQFLNKPVTEEIIENITQYTSFNKMKERGQPHVRFSPIICEDISPFLRSGKIGDWKNYFSQEQNQYFDKVCADKMKGSGFVFDFGE